MAPTSAWRSTATPTGCLLADEHGEIVDGDQILGLIAQYWGRAGRLTGDGVVATVMSNLGLERFLATENVWLCTVPRSATATSQNACAPAASTWGASSPAI